MLILFVFELKITFYILVDMSKNRIYLFFWHIQYFLIVFFKIKQKRDINTRSQTLLTSLCS